MKKLGMNFSQNVDFGSIERYQNSKFQLLSDDINKLNTMLTREYCTPRLAFGSFDVPSGSVAIVLDTPSVYQYYGQGDEWYEVIPVEE